MVSNLYVRQANLKVIRELTGSQCSSERRAVAGCCERLGKTTARATQLCTRCNFYRATRMHSADYAVARCLSVRPSVCHTPVLSLNGYTYPHSFSIIR